MAKRKVKNNIDQASITNQTYNERAGAEKTISVGPNLLALNDGANGFTTNAFAAKALPAKGKNLAIYNNSGIVASVTLGEDATIAALAAGVCDAQGHVGIPCPPNEWSFIACWDKQWVRTSATTLLVFLIADESDAQ